MNSSCNKKSKQAINTNICNLFHFQEFKGKEDYLIRLLRDKTIYCSNPSNFNDPWDCKISWNTDYSNNQIGLEKLRCYLIKNTTIDQIRTIETVNFITQNQFNIKNHIENISNASHLSHEKTFRIYCLTTSPKDILMWSHYAKNHTGICLEFSTTNDVFGSAWEVNYSTDHPVFHIYDEEFDSILLLTSKSTNWNYEKEWRIIAREKSMTKETDHGSLVSNSGIINLPRDSLKSIIVGCNGDFDSVKKIVDEFSPGLPIKKAIKINGKYSIEIE
ncbi:MAG: DUF2971 domain-containing protein [Burkholderiaceae bacterium]|nr:DUF2971 domain-containing protein [Burkholderiaceae bacterium]